MSETVKVRFSVTLTGTYSREVDMPVKDFLEMDGMNSLDLEDTLTDWIRWGDVDIEVDGVDEFGELSDE